MGNWREFQEMNRGAYGRDDREDESIENPCPCCGKELTHKNYTEEGYVVESVSSCKCGYSSGTSYGDRFLELPEGFIENENGEIVNTADDIEIEEIDLSDDSGSYDSLIPDEYCTEEEQAIRKYEREKEEK